MQTRAQRGAGPSVYEDWMQGEGIAIYDEGVHGIEDLTELPRRPWARMGGSGTFVQLEGTKQAYKGLYVVEIPGGGALEPEKHMYDELIYVLRGRGAAEVWQVGGNKRNFEWGEGSLFAIPTNAWHRLMNGSQEPALLFVSTNAPAVMNSFHNTEFIFNCDYNFTDRYTEKDDFFQATENRYNTRGKGFMTVWETNFVPDVRTALLADMPEKAEGGTFIAFRMAAWAGGHVMEWPPGKYHKAHYHAPGAVITGTKSHGFGIVWPREYGIHPYQDGHGDKVIKMDWKAGSIYSPCTDWFHQHFNTGPEPARQLAITGGGVGGGMGFLKGWSACRNKPNATLIFRSPGSACTTQWPSSTIFTSAGTSPAWSCPSNSLRIDPDSPSGWTTWSR